MFIFLWRFCRTSIDSALWGFLHCRDLIWARCVRCDSHCVFLGPVDNHMLQGNYPIEANMGGECCHWDVTPLPMCVQTDSLFHYFVLHRECDEKMIHWRVQTTLMMNLRHICVCLSLCTFSFFSAFSIKNVCIKQDSNIECLHHPFLPVWNASFKMCDEYKER